MSKSIDLIQPDRGQSAIAIHLVNKDGFAEWAKKLTKGQRASLDAQKFDGGGYQVGIVPDGDGWFAVGGVADPASLSSWCMAKLAESLPEGTYRRADGEPGPALFGWQTAQYRFTRYRDDEKAPGPRVLLTKYAKAIEPALAEARASMHVATLVNTPAEDMGPAALEAEMEALAKAHKAKLSVVKGEALEREYPMVHAVGRAAAEGDGLVLMAGSLRAKPLAATGNTGRNGPLRAGFVHNQRHHVRLDACVSTWRVRAAQASCSRPAWKGCSTDRAACSSSRDQFANARQGGGGGRCVAPKNLGEAPAACAIRS